MQRGSVYQRFFQLSDGLYKEINTHKCALNRIPHGFSSALAMDAPGYSSSTILTAVACLGAVCAGLYVVWGPEHFFRRKGNSSQSTRHSLSDSASDSSVGMRTSVRIDLQTMSITTLQ